VEKLGDVWKMKKKRVALLFVLVIVFAVCGCAFAENSALDKSKSKNVMYFVEGEGVTDEYSPALMLYSDGTFTFIINFLEGMGSIMAPINRTTC
jgi:hypothetical protein